MRALLNENFCSFKSTFDCFSLCAVNVCESVCVPNADDDDALNASHKPTFACSTETDRERLSYSAWPQLITRLDRWWWWW